VKKTDIDVGNTKGLSEEPVLLLDTMGELASIYTVSDIVFIGGSLVNFGGHNFMEASCLGKAVLFGPFMFNFRDDVEAFKAGNAAREVEDQHALETGIRQLLNEPEHAAAMGQRARELLAGLRGATQKNVKIVKEILEKYRK